MAQDDPDGIEYRRLIEEKRAGRPGRVRLSNVDDGGDLAVNAFLRLAAVVIPTSVRHGFGLTAGEARWTLRPVVGGHAGGVRIQTDDGVNGYLVESVAEDASGVAARGIPGSRS